MQGGNNEDQQTGGEIMSTTYTENYQLGMQENHNDKFSMAVIT